MKIKVVIVILAIVCVGLGLALFAVKQRADDQHKKDAASIASLSDQAVAATKQVDELGQVNLAYSNELVTTRQEMTQFSNSLTAATVTLADTRNSLAGAQNEITNLNTRISDLEAQNKALDQQAVALTNRIAQLSASIEETENKLAVAETNRDFLQRELQKQLAEKAELQRKFNDLGELRAQVKKIRDELFVARRLELMKHDLGDRRGAALLLSRNLNGSSNPATAKPAPAQNYDLNVEVGSDGSVRVIPPLGAPTNSAAH
jgi:chromosome segregation ATPase